MPEFTPPMQTAPPAPEGAPAPPVVGDAFAELLQRFGSAQEPAAPGNESSPSPGAPAPAPETVPAGSGAYAYDGPPVLTEGEATPYAAFLYFHPERVSELPAEAQGEANRGALMHRERAQQEQARLRAEISERDRTLLAQASEVDARLASGRLTQEALLEHFADDPAAAQAYYRAKQMMSPQGAAQSSAQHQQEAQLMRLRRFPGSVSQQVQENFRRGAYAATAEGLASLQRDVDSAVEAATLERRQAQHAERRGRVPAGAVGQGQPVAAAPGSVPVMSHGDRVEMAKAMLQNRNRNVVMGSVAERAGGGGGGAAR